jgi:hypothetical protein
VSFYEKSYYFDYAYRCKVLTEEYVNSHSDFFACELGSYVQVQSKTDPYYDYPREMYIYKGKIEDGSLALSELQYLTDAYAIGYSEPAELDIKVLTITDYGDFDSAYAVAEMSPALEEIVFETDERRLPDEEQTEKLREIAPEGCEIEFTDAKS